LPLGEAGSGAGSMTCTWAPVKAHAFFKDVEWHSVPTLRIDHANNPNLPNKVAMKAAEAPVVLDTKDNPRDFNNFPRSASLRKSEEVLSPSSPRCPYHPRRPRHSRNSIEKSERAVKKATKQRSLCRETSNCCSKGLCHRSSFLCSCIYF
jgi:hypothetical protein